MKSLMFFNHQKFTQYWYVINLIFLLFLFIFYCAKGQLISKIFFGIINSPKYKQKNSTCFRSFFEGNWRHQKDISKLTDLYPRFLEEGNYEIFIENRRQGEGGVEKPCIKVHIFWEGHKILRNLHLLFVLCTASQIIGGDFD